MREGPPHDCGRKGAKAQQNEGKGTVLKERCKPDGSGSGW